MGIFLLGCVIMTPQSSIKCVYPITDFIFSFGDNIPNWGYFLLDVYSKLVPRTIGTAPCKFCRPPPLFGFVKIFPCNYCKLPKFFLLFFLFVFWALPEIKFIYPYSTGNTNDKILIEAILQTTYLPKINCLFSVSV